MGDCNPLTTLDHPSRPRLPLDKPRQTEVKDAAIDFMVFVWQLEFRLWRGQRKQMQ